ncbi:HAMP domain-containing sensor histidine kinase [Aneurinibacillus aneurinilyticus]|uniref:histidine kinase n=1 Tax=Aneurinibacillus aneurinilyticus TaxID=1391 RepID=A0A848CUE7_ANEAE|nr:HAMP domain-containing sensor histidine kinase [Aneurinibacillus aneurinilyticus]MCI1696361.1 HAMP domain-containing histidine kinase [Aneurinibacillus aneurinilyticus]NME98768.1 HAMP domain-containing histidine kinase [Aneurinibacillus aneurinilyticus]
MKWKMTGLFLVPLLLMTVAFTAINLTAAFYFLSGEENPEKEASESFFSYTEYTVAFARFITFVKGKPSITKEGQAQLIQRKAWIQILDQNGNEAYSLRRPESAPVRYTPGELVHYYKYSGAIEDSTLFVSWVSKGDEKWTYIIGYPMSYIAKYMVEFNPLRIMTFWKEGILTVLGLTFLMVLTIGYFFGRKLTKPLVEIINGIKLLAQGRYMVKYQPEGLYKDVYQSLNQLADALQASAVQRARTEKMRDEWVTNLSHDIKTPLSSIQGYGEILADLEYEIVADERRKYAEIIVGKTRYIESLLDDLRLTYQLKNHLLPLDKKESNIVEMLRQIIIDLLNDPQYGSCKVEFIPECEQVFLVFDQGFLTRAFTNLIYNAVIHNPPNTQVQIQVMEREKAVEIIVEDNGRGIEEEEVKRLFTRYYRGTNTNERHQGSGLGMAIAKQIIEAHQGIIEVKSRIGEGTCIRILFPKTEKEPPER